MEGFMNIYQENGFKNRREYLESLAEEYDRETVFALAGILGPNEDFDGLVTSLEDSADY
jgi:hypothetical protein